MPKLFKKTDSLRGTRFICAGTIKMLVPPNWPGFWYGIITGKRKTWIAMRCVDISHAKLD